MTDQQATDVINDQQPAVSPVHVTGAFHMGAFDSTVLCDTTAAGFTVTLPASPVAARPYNVKKISVDGNAVTVAPVGPPLIDNAATVTINLQYDSLAFVFDGTNWWIV